MRGPENDQPLPPLPPPAAACLARPQASSAALEPPGRCSIRFALNHAGRAAVASDWRPI